MDFVPHTSADDRAMLDRLGLGTIDELFEPVPPEVRIRATLDVPAALSEPELIDHLTRLAATTNGSDSLVCFAGGGAYDHYVPAAVRALATRAEFATSYTPYQPELSQGVLQAIFEFQTCVCELYGLDVANASLYDGANALAEAANLAVRATAKDRVLVGATVHPHYVELLRTYTSGLGIDVKVVPAGDGGVVEWAGFDAAGAAAVIAQSPNFFGLLEDIETAADAAHAGGALAIAVTDPTAMGILESPGAQGADVAVGEGIALGNSLSYGGPAVGLFATRQELVRQVPGRIAGETLDADGRRAFVLTLQAREQHIRRAKATSNVCTNQTLMAIAAAVHLSWLGPHGLRRLGELCVARTDALARRLAEIPGCEVAFAGPRFKELVLRTPASGPDLVGALVGAGFLVGPALGRWRPDLSDCILVAATERRTGDEIESVAEAIEKELAGR
jgi:glycine dehydrogenase subunit 1